MRGTANSKMNKKSKTPTVGSKLSNDSNKVVFVLGAGASAEFGEQFPLGSALKDRIADHLRAEISDIPDPGFDGDRKFGPITLAYIRAVRSTTGLREAMHQIMHSVHDYGSIDDLLNDWKDRPDMQFVAKIAISLIIAKGESGSPINRLDLQNETGTQTAFTELGSTWLSALTRTFLKDRISRREVHKALEQAVFINFNYDRSVERFLFHAFITRCQLPVSQAINALERVRIIHPYGSLGALKFDRPQDGYGIDKLDLNMAANQIRTYNEELSDKFAINEIRNLCKFAKRTYMLGFGFHRANVDLLFGDRANPVSSTSTFKGPIFGTVYRLTGRARARADSLLADRKGELVAVEASQLMADHGDVLEQL